MSKGEQRSANPLDQSALTLEWAHGANTNILNGVFDLKDDSSGRIFYASAHTGIILDTVTNTQTLLPGHKHTITSIATTADRNFIATGDTGDESALIVWDSHSAMPVFTKLTPHMNGTRACAFSRNGQYLATLSADDAQVLAIWVWSSTDLDPEPTALVSIPLSETMKQISFNPSNDNQLITNGDKSIIFWSWNSQTDELSYYAPPVSGRDLKKTIGHLIYSRYLPDNDSVVVSTSDGSVIQLVRDPFMVYHEHNTENAEHKAAKVIQLHKSAINTLEIHNNYIVTGGADGVVKFFDFEFRLIASFEEIKAGPITSISFAVTNLPVDRDKFSCQPFVIATSNANILRLTDAIFEDVTGANQPHTILCNHTGNVKAMAVNARDGRVATGSDCGEVFQWDIVNHIPVVRTTLEKMSVSALRYDPCEDFLAIGFTSGQIMIVTTENFDEVYSQRITKGEAVTDIQYCSDSSFLTVTLSDNTMALFRSLDKLSPTTPMMSQAQDDDKVQMATIQQEMKKWEYIGRHRSHWDSISGLAFIGNGSQLSPHRLFTIGRDRRVVEYDYANSAYLDGVLTKMQTQVEMTAHPTSFAWTIKDNRPFFVVANTEGKLRNWSGDTMRCMSTTLAPSFGGDITHMRFIEQQRQAIVYATDSCVLGLILSPLTGNPNEAMGLIAHPVNIAQIAVSADESRVLICSGVDNYIGIFNAHPEHLEAGALLAARDGDPFVAMLDGGENGPLYHEIVDYFYSSQLRVQGKLTDKPHDITKVIPIEEVVPLLCALGYYPTQYEADIIRNEIYYSKFLETNQTTETIDFPTFLRLFLNHRPVSPPSLDDIIHAFSVLGADENGMLATEDLINILQSSGEAMSIEEIEKAMETLAPGEDIPSHLTAQEFVEQILGLMSGEEEEEDPEYMTSEYAAQTQTMGSLGGASGDSTLTSTAT